MEARVEVGIPTNVQENPGADDNAPPASKGERTRQRILEAAARRFRRDGYAATSLRAIAADADLRDGSLYYHFPTKEDLVDEVLRTGLRSIEAATRSAVEELGPGATAVQRLRAAVDAHVRMNLAAGDFASANLRILGQLPPEVRERHEREQLAYARLWEELLADGRARGAVRSDLNPTLVRLIFLGAMNWAVEWYDPARADATEVAEVCSEMILRGLVPRSQEGHAWEAQSAEE